jgi:hypothetical protein
LTPFRWSFKGSAEKDALVVRSLQAFIDVRRVQLYEYHRLEGSHVHNTSGGSPGSSCSSGCFRFNLICCGACWDMLIDHEVIWRWKVWDSEDVTRVCTSRLPLYSIWSSGSDERNPQCKTQRSLTSGPFRCKEVEVRSQITAQMNFAACIRINGKLHMPRSGHRCVQSACASPYK